jgi:hypothetical protein
MDPPPTAMTTEINQSMNITIETTQQFTKSQHKTSLTILPPIGFLWRTTSLQQHQDFMLPPLRDAPHIGFHPQRLVQA